ncbi:hypothetical protein BGW38_008622 [Lunasporangiospora selenospora]|uniref:Uncharacterized protein n=1 Tax=Lunasporangiospora selenospora TaxID=979761 RepID=A0A9P6G3Z0_9FUNG|nr:hypothetical protein BGW38_008622 [Lunasporangiospora selenospora]
MKFSLKAAALTALATSLTAAAPIEKRDVISDRIFTCFAGLLLTGSWPGSCQAAVSVDMGLIKSIAINQMSMDFTTANPWIPSTSSNSVVATMLSLPGITLPIDKIRQSIIIVDNNYQIGTINTPWAQASTSGATLTTSFPESVLTVFPDAHDAFSGFVASLSTKASHSFVLKGAVDAQLNLGIFGRLTIPNIGFKSTVPMAGLNGLKVTKYLYLIDVLTLPDGSLTISTIVNLENTSKLSVKLGDVIFSTYSNSNYVGVSTIKGLTLVPGNNYVISSTYLDGSIPATKDTSTTNPALNAGLSAIQSELTIPQAFSGSVMSQPPYSDWSLKTLPNTNKDLIVEASVTFKSPYYGFPMEMTADSLANQIHSAVINGVSNEADGTRLFYFMGALKYSVTGSGAYKATFNVKLRRSAFPISEKAKWQKVIDYATANKKIPVKLNWTPYVIINNDGVVRKVDWGTDSVKLSTISVSVGSDFASIIGAFPA